MKGNVGREVSWLAGELREWFASTRSTFNLIRCRESTSAWFNLHWLEAFFFPFFFHGRQRCFLSYLDGPSWEEEKNADCMTVDFLLVSWFCLEIHALSGFRPWGFLVCRPETLLWKLKASVGSNVLSFLGSCQPRAFWSAFFSFEGVARRLFLFSFWLYAWP